MDIKAEKQNLRKKMFEIRKMARQQNGAADTAISTIFKESDFFKKADFSGPCYVAGYLPINSEISPLILLKELREMGAKLVMPAVAGAEKPLEFRPWDDNTPLCDEAYGTKAPIRPKEYENIIPTIIFVPLLAFDKGLYRLGYGGGFYDRTIGAMPSSMTIGLAHDEQFVDSVPTDAYDVPLQAVITPTKIITTN